MKQKYNNLQWTGIPTGDQNCLPLVTRAIHLFHQIGDRANVRQVNESFDLETKVFLAPSEMNTETNPLEVTIRLPPSLPLVAPPPRHGVGHSIGNCGGSASRRTPIPPTSDGYMNMMQMQF